MVRVEVIATEELGDRSYVAHDGTSAVVVDPQRDLDRVYELLNRLGLRCALVAETHIHNDYVTGGFELARRHGVPYLVAAADDVSFERHPVTDGEVTEAGGLTVRALATPGHTDTHLAYLVSDADGQVVFTGGSLLYGSVGRTDLVDPERTGELTRAQYHSARRLGELLADDTAVYPTHGFGSFCSSGASAGDTGSTIGIERGRNDAFVEQDEDAFVRRLTEGLTAYPRYYAHMAARNKAGPGPADLSPPMPVDPAELRERIAAGEWVVDLRERTAFAAKHLAGTIGIPLGTQFATYLGWLYPWDTPLTLIGDSAEQVADAQRQLVRIGIDRLAGANSGSVDALSGPGTELRGYPVATFAQFGELGAQDVVLDVRRDDERAAGAIPGSAHIPLHTLPERLDELPAGTLWVYCASGYRSAIAASLLDRAGRDVVHVDDEYDAAVRLGLTG
jgi:hydroxyacylglutathione hydrolase